MTDLIEERAPEKEETRSNDVDLEAIWTAPYPAPARPQPARGASDTTGPWWLGRAITIGWVVFLGSVFFAPAPQPGQVTPVWADYPDRRHVLRARDGGDPRHDEGRPGRLRRCVLRRDPRHGPCGRLHVHCPPSGRLVGVGARRDERADRARRSGPATVASPSVSQVRRTAAARAGARRSEPRSAPRPCAGCRSRSRGRGRSAPSCRGGSDRPAPRRVLPTAAASAGRQA